jgi:hypothetical protein
MHEYYTIVISNQSYLKIDNIIKFTRKRFYFVMIIIGLLNKLEILN